MKNLTEKGAKIGYNPALISSAVATRRKTFFKDGGFELASLDKDLVDEIWTDKPKEPEEPIYIHTLDFAGLESIKKIEQLAQKCKPEGVKYYLTATLDEIAWILNIRGNDIHCTPVSISNLLLDVSDPTKASGTLFIKKNKVPAEVETFLNGNGIQVKEYNETVPELKKLEGKIGLWKAECNSKLVDSIKEEQIVDIKSPIQYLKGVKNEREVKGMKDCNIRDCSALAAFFAYLHEELVVKKRTDLNEVQAAEKVAELRSKIKWFKELSFETISAVGGNAAMAHYDPKPGKCSNLSLDKVYLLDSGAQYLYDVSF